MLAVSHWWWPLHSEAALAECLAWIREHFGGHVLRLHHGVEFFPCASELPDIQSFCGKISVGIGSIWEHFLFGSLDSALIFWQVFAALEKRNWAFCRGGKLGQHNRVVYPSPNLVTQLKLRFEGATSWDTMIYGSP